MSRSLLPAMIGWVLAWALAWALACAHVAPASAQSVLYRRPFDGDRAITAGFDTNFGAAGCADYECAGRCYDGHNGTDFGMPVGTPIVAAADGRVVSVMTGCPDIGYACSPCGGLCGNQVRLEHDDGSVTLHCHMQSGGMRVSVGERVRCGQVIGHSASSGCSTGPHLHFGFYPSAAAYASYGADDPFRGTCGGPYSRWVSQGPYSGLPGTACQCVPAAESCNGRDDDCDGSVDEGLTRACSTDCGAGTETCTAGGWGACSAPAPVGEVCNGLDDDCDGSVDEGDLCEVELLHSQPSAYAPPRSTDVNGDGIADLCARGASGVRCWPATGAGWDEEWAPIPWSDDVGWGDVDNYATLRMGDVNGDGLADVCARANAGVHCAPSTGEGFAPAGPWQGDLSDAAGWDEPRHYTTLRLADVDGDGMDDLCGRGALGLDCWLSDGSAFARHVEGPRWSDESGWGVAKHYGTIRMGDLDGDGRADVCARSAAGMRCWRSDGSGFPTEVIGPAWNGGNWGSTSHWSTIRMLDYDGDGRADLCARDSDALACARSRGDGFEEPVVVAPLSDASGWNDPSSYATLRAADIDGDGAEELCARSDSRVHCWRWEGSGFEAIDGPEWSDASGFDAPHYYETLRAADVNGDGRDDLCVRTSSDWRCHPSTGAGFGDALVLDELTNAGSWTEHRYWSTILSAGRACRVEVELCNGRDDDCDGEIDEGLSCASAGTDGGRPPPDAGVGADGAGGAEPFVSGGCACRADGTGHAPGGLALLALSFAVAWARRRVRRVRLRARLDRRR